MHENFNKKDECLRNTVIYSPAKYGAGQNIIVQRETYPQKEIKSWYEFVWVANPDERCNRELYAFFLKKNLIDLLHKILIDFKLYRLHYLLIFCVIFSCKLEAGHNLNINLEKFRNKGNVMRKNKIYGK